MSGSTDPGGALMTTEAPVSCTVTVPTSLTRAYALFTEREGWTMVLGRFAVHAEGHSTD
jgi:hypothetical protein